MNKLETIRDYFETINLGDYDLEGCEFTDDDFRTILLRVENGDSGLEEVVHQYLLEIREVLDEGLGE